MFFLRVGPQPERHVEGEPPAAGLGTGPHLDVLYHDAVSKTVSLQVSFDIFQFRERNSHVHGKAGSGGATPEVHLAHKTKKNRRVYRRSLHTVLGHPGEPGDLLLYRSKGPSATVKTLRPRRKTGTHKQNPQVTEFLSLISSIFISQPHSHIATSLRSKEP